MTAWRDDPRLSGRFHPQYPDDLQVIVHDGGPRTTSRRPELVWVRVVAARADAFVGQLLNAPHQLETAHLGDEIFFVPAGNQHPIRVTAQYLAERPDWNIHPCQACGLSELFDPPSVLLRTVFSNAPPDAQMEMFSAICGACGGVQIVAARTASPRA